MLLHIILRTHDRGNVHQIGSRNVNASKQEIIFRCAFSLKKAIDVVVDHDIKLSIIDDHSGADTVDFLESLFNKKIINLTEKGNNASMVASFDLATTIDSDLVYFVEDDYLHEVDSLNIMFAEYQRFSQLFNIDPICLCPIDDVNNYRDPFVTTTKIVPGTDRLWRLNVHTNGTFLTKPEVIQKYPEFLLMAEQYGITEGINEGTTWNNIWKIEVPLLTPLTPLAFHLNEWTHPVFDHTLLWKNNSI